MSAQKEQPRFGDTCSTELCAIILGNMLPTCTIGNVLLVIEGKVGMNTDQATIWFRIGSVLRLSHWESGKILRMNPELEPMRKDYFRI